MRSGLINSSELSGRFNPTYHLYDGIVFEKLIKTRNFEYLSTISSSIFTSGRVKRIYTNPEFGIPYLGNNEIRSQSPLMGCKFISKKFFDQEDSYLKNGMILTGRVGQDTVGSYTYCTKDYHNTIGSDNVVRILIKPSFLAGYVYAFLSSKYGYSLTRRHIAGGAQPFITEDMLGQIPIPLISDKKQEEINQLILEANELRIEANKLLTQSNKMFFEATGLRELTNDDFEHFGPRADHNRKLFYYLGSDCLSPVSINAFNYSERIRNLVKYITAKTKCITLHEALDDEKFFSTGSFPRLEIDSPRSIKLINQSDIFNIDIVGKQIARKKVRVDNLVAYGEVLIAGVGTLGESESFCRTIFANEDLKGELVSGEFIRMNSNETVLPGYLFCWLSSEYGFRLIRSTQSGTKQCRPIHSLLYSIPIPIVDKIQIRAIHNTVCKAHTKRYEANCLEKTAKSILDKVILSWQK